VIHRVLFPRNSHTHTLSLSVSLSLSLNEPGMQRTFSTWRDTKEEDRLFDLALVSLVFLICTHTHILFCFNCMCMCICWCLDCVGSPYQTDTHSHPHIHASNTCPAHPLPSLPPILSLLYLPSPPPGAALSWLDTQGWSQEMASKLASLVRRGVSVLCLFYSNRGVSVLYSNRGVSVLCLFYSGRQRCWVLR
jgi:hypothetical protein